MSKEKIPGSVPAHLLELNQSLWSRPENPVNFTKLPSESDSVVSGSAFVDLADPYGKKGNPFTVLIGPGIGSLTPDEKNIMAQKTGTPETIFVNSCTALQTTEKPEYELNLTVKTPTGTELGACAHGFTGAIQVLMDSEKVSSPAVIHIKTTLETTATAHLSENRLISLEFEAIEPVLVNVDGDKLQEIFGVNVFPAKNEFPVLSVGSRKLTIEVRPDQFTHLQQNLGSLKYDSLRTFQDELKINGIHIFCRDAETGRPENVIQVNAYLGKENVVDPATGVSCAAQVSADTHVSPGETVKLTQYTAKGPSADLFVTKGENGKVFVGGTAVLFNYLSTSL